MRKLEVDRQRIQKSLNGVRDRVVRTRLGILMLITESKSVTLGCKQQGITRQTFYTWLGRLRRSDFDAFSLAEKSRRPKKSPRKISDAIELQVEEMAAQYGHSDRLLAIEFQNKTGIKLSHSTICKILKRRNRVRKYKTPKPNKFTRRYSMPNSLDRTQSDTLWTGLSDNYG
ncbi:MAG TPA: leucine zipper domain-containing protein, partial [Ferruginibacter sp.]|nr:leucine zipper domain-containing protein [Ferruginibacter sp.]